MGEAMLKLQQQQQILQLQQQQNLPPNTQIQQIPQNLLQQQQYLQPDQQQSAGVCRLASDHQAYVAGAGSFLSPSGQAGPLSGPCCKKTEEAKVSKEKIFK